MNGCACMTYFLSTLLKKNNQIYDHCFHFFILPQLFCVYSFIYAHTSICLEWIMHAYHLSSRFKLIQVAQHLSILSGVVQFMYSISYGTCSLTIGSTTSSPSVSLETPIAVKQLFYAIREFLHILIVSLFQKGEG